MASALLTKSAAACQAPPVYFFLKFSLIERVLLSEDTIVVLEPAWIYRGTRAPRAPKLEDPAAYS